MIKMASREYLQFDQSWQSAAAESRQQKKLFISTSTLFEFFSPLSHIELYSIKPSMEREPWITQPTAEMWQDSGVSKRTRGYASGPSKAASGLWAS